MGKDSQVGDWILHLNQLCSGWGANLRFCCFLPNDVYVSYQPSPEYQDRVSQDAKCSRYKDKFDVFNLCFSFRRPVLWECQINKQSVKNGLYSGEAVVPGEILTGFSKESASELCQ